MAPECSDVEVEIFGQTYTLFGEPDYLRELAEYVDGKMRDFAEENSMVDTCRLAVLAALNFAAQRL